MKHFLFALLAVFILTFGGCVDNGKSGGTRPEQSVATNVPTPEKVMTPQEQKIATLQKQLTDSDQKAALATANNNIIARLTAEKESLMIRTQLAEVYAIQWKQNAASYSAQAVEKNQELKDAKLEAWKEKLWWMAGICGVVALIAGAVAWGMPLVRPIAMKASIILAALAGLMLFVAESLATVAWLLGFVPYILGFGGLVAIGYAVVALRHWWKDHHGLKQTIEGIEPIKDQFVGFSEHMIKHVDSTLCDHVNAYRNKMFTEAKKVATSITDDVKKVEDKVEAVVSTVVDVSGGK